MRPLVKYRGGKSKEIPQLIWHIPHFSGRYIEPFFGGGALFFHLEPERAIINDINPKLIEFYKGVRNDYLQLREELNEIQALYENNRKIFNAQKALHPSEKIEDKNEDLYYELRAMFNNLSEKRYSDALLYFFINKTAYSGMIRYNAKGEFNVPFGRYQHLNTQGISLAHSRLLQRSEIYNCDYKEIFEMCQPDDFVFLDPPYDCIFSDYGNDEYKEGFGESEHRRLAEDFKNLPCKALMVVGGTPMIKDLYKGYIVDEYAKSYAVNIRNRFKAEATHLVITNYTKRWKVPSSSYNNPVEAKQLMLFEATVPYGKID
ncbi:MAG: Dam family site-specific DNA-(adenine-N6)-methyltransferase [Bacteroidales bacterium]|nr:Dam family site-specific DNA-(adenine-N6)-methyltransferase [Bacteroidales bacterium]